MAPTLVNAPHVWGEADWTVVELPLSGGAVRRPVRTRPGTRYRLAFSLEVGRFEGDGPVRIAVLAGGTTMDIEQAPHDGWERYALYFTARGTRTEITIWGRDDSAQYVGVDGVTVVPVSRRRFAVGRARTRLGRRV